MIEVHVAPTGWRKFEEANAWGIAEEDGTLRLVETSGPPSWEFRRWIAIFPRGGWQGLTWTGDVELASDVKAASGKYGFKMPGAPSQKGGRLLSTR